MSTSILRGVAVAAGVLLGCTPAAPRPGPVAVVAAEGVRPSATALPAATAAPPGEAAEPVDPAAACGAAWLVLGRAARAAHREEDARAFLARSARLDPQGEAARLLGSASRCTAAAHAPAKEDEPLTIVTGWKGVFASVDPLRMAREELPEPTSEAQAKARACVSGELPTLLVRNVCKGPGPWQVQTGRIELHDARAIILPLPGVWGRARLLPGGAPSSTGHRFAILAYLTGDGCRGGTDMTATLEGGVIVVRSAIHGSLAASAGRCDDGKHDPMMTPCIHSERRVTSFHDASTGAALLHLDDHDDAERVEVSGSRVHRTGPAGCDETLDLRRLPLGLVPRAPE